MFKEGKDNGKTSVHFEMQQKKTLFELYEQKKKIEYLFQFTKTGGSNKKFLLVYQYHYRCIQWNR